MLEVPRKGFGRSRKENNIQDDAFRDWVEASVIFFGDISEADIVGALMASEIYDDTDSAWAFVSNKISQMQFSTAAIQADYPISFVGGAVSQRKTWDKSPAEAFCLFLSVLRWYPDIQKSIERSFSEQGHLFELLMGDSLAAQLKGFDVFRTGWSGNGTQRKKIEIVQKVCELANEEMPTLKQWQIAGNDGGLDLVAVRRFSDKNPAVPLILLQCASGKLSSSKVQEPNLNYWESLVGFVSKPIGGICSPHALTDDDFQKYSASIKGLLIDRLRILDAYRSDSNWLPRKTAELLVGWLTPKIKYLPKV